MGGSLYDQIILGDVQLSNGETYSSCRTRCKTNYPEFQYYQKYYQDRYCTCMKLKDGIEIRILGNWKTWTLGFATPCGITINLFIFTHSAKKPESNF